MRRLAVALAVLACSAALAAQAQDKPEAKPDAAKSDLALTLAADKAEYVLGDDVQIEATLTNNGEKDLEVAELTFDERSLSFDVTFETAPGKPRQFLFSVIKPDPHLVDRVTPPRVTLKAKKSVVGLFRIPTLKPGPCTVTGVYKGADKDVKSAALNLKVSPQAGDAARLAAILDTSMGTFQIDLLPEEAPNNVANFVSLARRGFYTSLLFHRVVKNSWIQTGCPYDNGYGGPGYAVRSEAENQTALHELGAVSMSGNMKTNFTGSQFFICLTKIPAFDRKFTVIGRVPESGHETIRKIGAVDVDKNTDRPTKEDIRLKEVKIVAVK
jgi:cyclophilin family peptidyl-prolyl cis-trans isomerase